VALLPAFEHRGGLGPSNLGNVDYRVHIGTGNSSLVGMSTPRQLMSKSGQELDRRFVVRFQGWLFFYPKLCVRKRLEYAPTAADRALHKSPVDEKQENDRSLMKRHCRPVGRVGQVVFEVQAGVTNGFPEQRSTMLVIAVQAVMSEVSHPEARQLINKCCRHGLVNPLGPSKV
jgi:hypothetical protein